MAATRMVGMRMGDDGALDGAPGVDEEVALRAVKALGPFDDQIVLRPVHQ